MPHRRRVHTWISSHTRLSEHLPLKSYSAIAQKILQHFKSPHSEVELRFVSSREMRQLNFHFRGKDKSTDVLSFPVRRGPLLGSIVIDMVTASLQALDLGHSIRREVDELYIHGLLHLLGFDHERKKDAKIMTKHEFYFRKKLLRS